MIGRSTTSALCFSQMRAASPWRRDRFERTWRSCGERYTACITVQGGTTEGCTDLYRLSNGILTAIKYRGEILAPPYQTIHWCSGPWASSQCMTKPDLMRQNFISRSWKMKELIPLTPMHIWPKSNRMPLGHYACPSDAPDCILDYQELSDALSRSGRRSPRTP